LAVEYAATGIRVNTVALGVIRTPMHPAETHEFLSGLHPVGWRADRARSESWRTRSAWRLVCSASPTVKQTLDFSRSSAIVKYMPNQPGLGPVGRVFHALADPTRRAIVERLVRGPATVKALAEPLTMSLPAVMQHLQVLEGAGVIVTEKVGRVRSCRIEPAALRTAEQWLTGQRTRWERQLDQLADYLKDG
jgi:DNA-binding transcriptional ArsR family regulator